VVLAVAVIGEDSVQHLGRMFPDLVRSWFPVVIGRAGPGLGAQTRMIITFLGGGWRTVPVRRVIAACGAVRDPHRCSPPWSATSMVAGGATRNGSATAAGLAQNSEAQSGTAGSVAAAGFVAGDFPRASRGRQVEKNHLSSRIS
jgi:hypothetical protein